MTGAEPHTSAYRAALRALQTAWATRPSTEIAAFTDTLAAAEQPPAGTDTDNDPGGHDESERIRELAAVSGAVSPRDLVRETTDPARRGRLLGAIATEFDRTVLGGRMKWTLRTLPRNRALRRLRDDPSELVDAVQR